MDNLQCIWDAKAELGEGVRYEPATNQVWWVDILGHKIYRLDIISGEKTVWETPEPVCATFAAKDGRVLALFRRSIVCLNLDDGSFDPIVEFDQEPENNRLNDGSVGTDGSLWIVSMDFDFQIPTGAIYRLSPNLDIERVDGNYIVVNGPALSPKGDRLYISDSMKGEILRFDVDPKTHRLLNKRILVKFEEGEGHPDGLYVDSAGGLWVAIFAGGKVRRYFSNGKIDKEIQLPCPNITSMCLGGLDGQTLFITTGRILMTKESIAAHPLSGGLFSLRVNQKSAAVERFG